MWWLRRWSYDHFVFWLDANSWFDRFGSIWYRTDLFLHNGVNLMYMGMFLQIWWAEYIRPIVYGPAYIKRLSYIRLSLRYIKQTHNYWEYIKQTPIVNRFLLMPDHVQWRTWTLGGRLEERQIPSVQLWSGFLNPWNVARTAWQSLHGLCLWSVAHALTCGYSGNVPLLHTSTQCPWYFLGTRLKRKDLWCHMLYACTLMLTAS